MTQTRQIFPTRRRCHDITVTRRALYREARRRLVSLARTCWSGRRSALRRAVRRFLLRRPTDFLLRLLRDGSFASAVAGCLLVGGVAEGAPAVELSAVSAGNGGFVIKGINESGFSGQSVSGAGDVNGDGLDDLIVGAGRADPDGKENAGESYVVFGKRDGEAVDLSAVSSGTGGFVIRGKDGPNQPSVVVSGTGDVNGDGFDDIIVHASEHSESEETHVVFGKADGEAVELSEVYAGTGGFVIKGGSCYGIIPRVFPCSVSGAGDVNGDGLDDIIFGSPGSETGYVVFGKADGAAVELSEVSSGAGGFMMKGTSGASGAGASVSGAGDLNGDGLADLIVGAPGDLPGADLFSLTGGSYVVFGKADGEAVELSEVYTGAGGFVIKGIDAGDRPGGSVSGVGDVNGDGIPDLLVGAFTADPDGKESAGESYVVFGKADGEAVELSEVYAGTGGFVIKGVDADDRSGGSVSDAGDVNGDGLADVLIGASSADPDGRDGAGESYVVFGKADGEAVELSAVSSGAGGFVIQGIDGGDGGPLVSTVGDHSGSSVSGGGDINGDGLADVIIGALFADPDDKENAGESYVVFSPFKRFIRGECNDDGAVDISDAVCILDWLFAGSPAPGCIAALNANGDSSVDIADPIWLLSFLFGGGAPPAPPFPGCGPGVAALDIDLGCETPPGPCL